MSGCPCARCEARRVVVANMKSTIEANQLAIATLKEIVTTLTAECAELGASRFDAEVTLENEQRAHAATKLRGIEADRRVAALAEMLAAAESQLQHAAANQGVAVAARDRAEARVKGLEQEVALHCRAYDQLELSLATAEAQLKAWTQSGFGAHTPAEVQVYIEEGCRVERELAEHAQAQLAAVREALRHTPTCADPDPDELEAMVEAVRAVDDILRRPTTDGEPR